MDRSLKVLVADDHPLVRAGIRRTLEASRGICVVGEAGSGTELLALIERRRPQLVLLDLRMPGLDGLQCIAAITRSWPHIRTVVISACEDRASIEGALAAGANGYVVKSASPGALAEAPAVGRVQVQDPVRLAVAHRAQHHRFGLQRSPSHPLIVHDPPDGRFAYGPAGAAFRHRRARAKRQNTLQRGQNIYPR